MSHLFNTYARRPLHLVKGEGTVVEDADGKKYLDFTSGIAVVSLGHAHPAIVKAIQVQSEKLWHISNLFESPEQEKLAATLTKDTHFSHSFFCNSGAEANEAAIKLARSIQENRSSSRSSNRSMGVLSVRWQQQVKKKSSRDSVRCFQRSRRFRSMIR